VTACSTCTQCSIGTSGRWARGEHMLPRCFLQDSVRSLLLCQGARPALHKVSRAKGSYLFTESHRITECLGLEGPSVGHRVQPPRQSRVTYSRLHRTLSRRVLNISREDIHNLPGQPVPVLCHPQREEVLPHVQTELPVLQFVPAAPCPVAGHH